MKSVIKEILIILLLCSAICLILGVIFYEYIPNNKVVPSTVEQYKTANTVKEEINQEVVEYQKQNITFEVTDSDLTRYKKTDTYNPGKANPFAASSNTIENTNTTTGGSTTTNTNPDSTDHFFNNTGLK